MLEFKSVSSGYGKARVLHGLSLCCAKGEITVLIGPNGCGKSTLLKTAVGVVPLWTGEIFADGESLSALNGRERAKKTAYLAQGSGVPDISVGRMVLQGRFPYLSYPRRYGEADLAAARTAMERMGIADLAHKPIAELSGGMRQRVYIAMALCQQADYILLDEPTTYLDIDHRFRLAELLKELRAEGKTVVAVLHDILLALKLADRLAIMESGVIKHFGTAEQLVDEDAFSSTFGVKVARLDTEHGTEYYYLRKGLE